MQKLAAKLSSLKGITRVHFEPFQERRPRRPMLYSGVRFSISRRFSSDEIAAAAKAHGFEVCSTNFGLPGHFQLRLPEQYGAHILSCFIEASERTKSSRVHFIASPFDPKASPENISVDQMRRATRFIQSLIVGK